MEETKKVRRTAKERACSVVEKCLAAMARIRDSLGELGDEFAEEAATVTAACDALREAQCAVAAMDESFRVRGSSPGRPKIPIGTKLNFKEAVAKKGTYEGVYAAPLTLEEHLDGHRLKIRDANGVVGVVARKQVEIA